MLEKLIQEIKNNLVVYILLLIIIVGSFVVRTYNINNLLGFYYDQGRDALAIWDLWHKGHIPFIGPTTGIAGIFRGPFYYYLIALFYLLGQGNPVWPSVMLSFTTTLAVVLIYYLGFKIQNRVTGLIAATLSAFSFNLILASRWLSNPTPMLLISLLLVWMMVLVTEGKTWSWAVISFLLGISLFHFGSSGEAFYFPAVAIFAIWQRKNLPTRKIFFVSCLLFLVTVLPLIAFDIKNHGLILNNIKKFLFEEKSFKSPSWQFVGDKFKFYYDVFTNKLFDARYNYEKIILSFVGLFFIYHLHSFIKNNGIRVLVLLLGSVTLGLIFFQGNFGNIYDYYLTGYYLIFILLFSVSLGYMWNWKIGAIFVVYFIFFFLKNNFQITTPRFTDTGLGSNNISFIAQKKAIDWIYKDAGGGKFNVDVYVPPVIPYAYDYLFKWLGNTKYSYEPSTDSQKVLYTLYEIDSDHEERLDAWLARQRGIGKVIATEHFGGITVERRLRYTK